MGIPMKQFDEERDEREILDLLRQVDHPVPSVDVATIVNRARGRRRGWGRWAAGILLFVGMAGAVYAMPGSPLQEWAQMVVAWVAGRDQPVPRQPQTVVPEVAGIAALPGKDFVILFESPEPGGLARVSLVEGDEVAVRAPAGAAGFTSSANRLVITNAGGGATFEIQVPRAAPRVTISVAGNLIFLKYGLSVTTDGRLEAPGKYLIPLSKP
jgi:hypothetical protein